MVIQCPHCQACFKLPLNKLKPGGTKVRCTKCKIVFMVTPPQQAAAPSAATEVGGAEATGAVREKSSPGDDFASDFDASAFFSDGDEGDEFLLGQEMAEEEQDDFFATDEAVFDAGDELAWEEEAREPLWAAPENENGGDLDGSGFDLPVAEPAPPVQPIEEPAAEIALTLAEEEAPQADGAAGGLGEEDVFIEEPTLRSPLPAPRPPAERRKRFPWLRFWLLALVVLAAAGGYVYQARQQLATSWHRLLVEWQLVPAPPAEGKALTPVKLAGYFVTNRREGRLFVVQGQVLNEGAEARAAIVVEGTLYDGAGRVMARQSAFCGNPMDKDQLRVWPMMRMAERMQNQFGEMLANLNLQPQKAIPFTLVFKELPAEVAEFEVVVQASEPVIR